MYENEKKLLGQIFKRLGEECPWEVIDNKPVFVEELKKELSKKHLLYGLETESIAKSSAKDDVLFAFENGDYVIVHLTWRGAVEMDPSWPMFRLFENLDGVIEYIQKSFVEEYLDRESLKYLLSDLSYKVTQESATERPFTNEFDNFFEKGLYVDIVSGEPLFTSDDKYQSGCGWPAFAKAIDHKNIVEKRDSSLGMERTEVRSKLANSHLGHVFTDGPQDKGGLRYCINSAALRFVPFDALEKEGYTDFKSLFDK